MTIATEQLAACTTLEDIQAVKPLLEIERDNASSLFSEYTSKANEYKVLANSCRGEIHDVDSLLKYKALEIING